MQDIHKTLEFVKQSLNQKEKDNVTLLKKLKESNKINLQLSKDFEQSQKELHEVKEKLSQVEKKQEIEYRKLDQSVLVQELNTELSLSKNYLQNNLVKMQELITQANQQDQEYTKQQQDLWSMRAENNIFKNQSENDKAIIQNLEERISLYKETLEKTVNEFNTVIYDAKITIATFENERSKQNEIIHDLQMKLDKSSEDLEYVNNMFNDYKITSQNDIESFTSSIKLTNDRLYDTQKENTTLQTQLMEQNKQIEALQASQLESRKKFDEELELVIRQNDQLQSELLAAKKAEVIRQQSSMIFSEDQDFQQEDEDRVQKEGVDEEAGSNAGDGQQGSHLLSYAETSLRKQNQDLKKNIKLFRDEFNEKVPILLNKQAEYDFVNHERKSFQEKNQKLKEEIIKIMKEKQQINNELQQLKQKYAKMTEHDSNSSYLRKEITHLLIQNDKLKTTLYKIKEHYQLKEDETFRSLVANISDLHQEDESTEQFLDIDDLQSKYYEILATLKKTQKENQQNLQRNDKEASIELPRINEELKAKLRDQEADHIEMVNQLKDRIDSLTNSNQVLNAKCEQQKALLAQNQEAGQGSSLEQPAKIPSQSQGFGGFGSNKIASKDQNDLISNLRKQLNDSNTNQQSLKNQNQQLQGSLRDITIQLNQKEGQYQGLLQENKSLRDDLNMTNNKLSAIALSGRDQGKMIDEGVQNENSIKLQSENRKLLEQVEAQNSKIESQQNEIEQLRKEIKSLTYTFEQKINENNSILFDETNSVSTGADIPLSLLEQNTELRVLKYKLNELVNFYKDQINSLTSSQLKDRAQIEDDSAKIMEQMSLLTGKIDEYQEKCKSELEQFTSTYKEKIDLIKQQLPKETESQVNNEENEDDDEWVALAEYEALEEIIKEKDSQIKKLKESIENYKESLLDERRGNTQIFPTPEDLAGQDTKQVEINKLCKKVVALQSQVRLLNDQIKNLRSIHDEEIGNLKRNLKDAYKEKDSLKDYLKLLEDKLEIVMQQIEANQDQQALENQDGQEELFRFISTRNKELSLEKESIQIQLKTLQNKLNLVTLEKKKEIISLKEKLKDVTDHQKASFDISKQPEFLKLAKQNELLQKDNEQKDKQIRQKQKQITLMKELAEDSGEQIQPEVEIGEGDEELDPQTVLSLLEKAKAQLTILQKVQ